MRHDLKPLQSMGPDELRGLALPENAHRVSWIQASPAASTENARATASAPSSTRPPRSGP